MSITRREFLVIVAFGPVFAAQRSPQSPGGWEEASLARVAGVASVPVASNPSIVSFHLDQPYLDLTGLQKPYVPPVGMRSGASLAAQSQRKPSSASSQASE